MSRAAGIFIAIGTLCIIAGGMLSAVTAHSPTRHATWAAAFLVLVVGVAQAALGTGQALLASRKPGRRLVAMEVLAYNVGSLLVLGGTLSGKLVLLDVGSVLLALALVLFFRGVNGAETHHGRLLLLYRVLLAVVLLSIPVGVLLAHRRAG